MLLQAIGLALTAAQEIGRTRRTRANESKTIKK